MSSFYSEEYTKVLVSGNVIEVFTMEKAPFMGDKTGSKTDEYNALDISTQYHDYHDVIEEKNKDFREKLKEKLTNKKLREIERRQQTTRDARNKVRRLTLSNFNNNSKFLTLTFKDNITDIEQANKMFKYFIQKKLKDHVKKRFPDFQLKYIAVIEFQKRGAVHYHMICNIPYTKHSELLSLWKCACGDGSVNVKNIESVDNVGAYIVKYMMKNAGDERLKGNKMYLNSKGLEQPKTYKGLSAKAVIDTYLKDKKEVYANSYDSEYLGKIDYREFNLKRK